MKNNLEKWNYYLDVVTNKTNNFIESQLKGKYIPSSYFVVFSTGKIVERFITETNYSHYKHNGKLYYSGKKPSKIDVESIKEYSEKDIPFNQDFIYFSYYEYYGNDNSKITSSVRLIDIINKNNLYYTIEEAEKQANKIKEDLSFIENNKKDPSYNYNANGYKFLGWQNGWKLQEYDEDGNLCSISGKPNKQSRYDKELYPEYYNCINSKHLLIHVSHNSRGSENTVSCPICKIYWKYDSSD